MNNRIIGTILSTATAFLIAACTPAPACPTVNPYGRSANAAAADINVDPDLKRILGDPVSWGQVPKNLRWSPDSKRFAYSRPGDTSLVSRNRLLWIFESVGMRERPLLRDPQPAVQEFEWLDADTLVLLSNGKFLKVSTEGDVTALGPKGDSNTAAIEHMRLSGDGLRVAFVRNCALETMTLIDGVVHRIASGTGRHCPGVVPEGYAAAFRTTDGFGWSNDGKSLWFYQPKADSPSSARIQVVRMNADSPQISSPVSVAGESDEYIPWVDFHPDGKQLCLVRLDRLQTHLTLEFCAADGTSCKAVVKESDPRWVNFLHPPVFFGTKGEFLLLSERTGTAHIYRYGNNGETVAAITEGNFSVFDINHVAADGKEVVFTADIRAPWIRSVYRRHTDEEDILPLSEEFGTHAVTYSPDGAYWLDTHSSVDRPAVTDLMDPGGALIAPVDQAMRRKYTTVDVVNEIQPIAIDDDTTLIAHWTRPDVINPNKKYPMIVVIDEIIGELTTTDSFNGVFSGWRNHLARMGIIVVSVDGSGKRGLGREVEARVHRNPVGVVLDDLRHGLDMLAQTPGVDPRRIGIVGRGLGATVALQLILKHSGDPAFRFGIIVDPLPGMEHASKPTIERYMQRPQDNPEGYAAAEVIPLLSDLKIPLFIACGSEEGQITFAATQQVITGFVKAGKIVDVACYALPINTVMDEATRVHLYSRITRFVSEHL